jgi:hypothetical protein
MIVRRQRLAVAGKFEVAARSRRRKSITGARHRFPGTLRILIRARERRRSERKSYAERE